MCMCIGTLLQNTSSEVEYYYVEILLCLKIKKSG